MWESPRRCPPRPHGSSAPDRRKTPVAVVDNGLTAAGRGGRRRRAVAVGGGDRRRRGRTFGSPPPSPTPMLYSPQPMGGPLRQPVRARGRARRATLAAVVVAVLLSALAVLPAAAGSTDAGAQAAVATVGGADLPRRGGERRHRPEHRHRRDRRPARRSSPWRAARRPAPPSSSNRTLVSRADVTAGGVSCSAAS